MLILGGYGGVGRSLSRLILKETNVNLIIAGRRKAKADEFTGILNKEYDGDRVSARYADASKFGSLAEAFPGTDMVIVTASATEYIEDIARAALGAGCDYLDILVRQKNVSILRRLAPDIKKTGRLFITQAGFHPGLPAVFIRQAASYFDDYQKAVIGMVMNARFERPESTHEIIHEIGEASVEIYKEGKWQKADYKDAIEMDFGPKFGLKQCYPLQMEEIRTLPQMLGLEETGVYVAGFNWFVDNFVFPLTVVFQKIRKGMGVNFLGKIMRWGVNTFSPPELGVVFVLEAAGAKEDKPTKVKIIAEHSDPYHFTSAPVVACLKQYLDGSIYEPGLYLMGNVVDCQRVMNDLENMALQIKTQVTN